MRQSEPISPRRVLEVTVPASTSNLGPGFDFLGLALSLFVRVRASAAASPADPILRSLTGTALDWPRSSDNVLLRAFALASRRLGCEAGALCFDVDSEIPIARGLGSSGAAVAAGLLLANHLARNKASIDELSAWGLEIEGHPDNSSAALRGGCTLSIPLPGGAVRVVQQALHPALGFVLAWPASTLPTSTARSLLPHSVPLADAVENPRRLALLLEGLRSAEPDLLRLGSEDRLHLKYRLPLIRGGDRALEAAHDQGAWLATISGSGSALVAIGPHANLDSIGAAMARELRHPSADAWHRVVHPVFGTPVVRELDSNTGT
jgi:homoserine kinase